MNTPRKKAIKDIVLHFENYIKEHSSYEDLDLAEEKATDQLDQLFNAEVRRIIGLPEKLENHPSQDDGSYCQEEYVIEIRNALRQEQLKRGGAK